MRSNWLVSSANRGDRVTDEMGGEKEVPRAEKRFRAVTVTSEESDAQPICSHTRQAEDVTIPSCFMISQPTKC